MTSQVEQVNKDLFRYAGRSLEAGGDKLPLTEFLGTCSEWDASKSPFPNDDSIFLVFKFEKVTVVKLRQDSQPYPYDTAELRIKHSTAQRSGFGFLQASINRALGVTDDVSDLEMMVGKAWHMKAEPLQLG